MDLGQANLLLVTSPIYRIRSFVRLVQRGPVNGTIAGKHRDWSLGSLVPFLIVLLFLTSSVLLHTFLVILHPFIILLFTHVLSSVLSPVGHIIAISD